MRPKSDAAIFVGPVLLHVDLASNNARAFLLAQDCMLHGYKKNCTNAASDSPLRPVPIRNASVQAAALVPFERAPIVLREERETDGRDVLVFAGLALYPGSANPRRLAESEDRDSKLISGNFWIRVVEGLSDGEGLKLRLARYAARAPHDFRGDVYRLFSHPALTLPAVEEAGGAERIGLVSRSNVEFGTSGSLDVFCIHCDGRGEKLELAQLDPEVPILIHDGKYPERCPEIKVNPCPETYDATNNAVETDVGLRSENRSTLNPWSLAQYPLIAFPPPPE